MDDLAKILHVANTKEEIRQSIEDVSGIEVSKDLPFRQYSDRIRELDQWTPTGFSDLIYEDIPIPDPLKFGSLTVFNAPLTREVFWCLAGNDFITRGQEFGIWWFNVKDRRFDKVWSPEGNENGYNQFWQSDKGDIFVHSGVNVSPGLLWWNGANFVKVIDRHETHWTTRHQFQDELFIGSTSGSAGLWRWMGDRFEQVIFTGHTWSQRHEFDGKLFLSTSASAANVGLFYWNAEKEEFEQLIGSRNWRTSYVIENELYFPAMAGDTSFEGIWRWNGEGLDRVFTEGLEFENFVDNGKGITFLSVINSQGPRSTGILKVENREISRVPIFGQTGVNWVGSPDNDGNVTFSSVNSHGLILWNHDLQTMETLISTGIWGVRWRTRNGDRFYSGSAVAARGLIVVRNGSKVAEDILTAGLTYNLLLDDSPNNVFFFTTSTDSDYQGLYHWDGVSMTANRISPFQMSNTWNASIKIDENSFIFSGSTANTGIWWWNGENLGQVYSSGHDWRIFTQSEHDDALFITSGTAAISGILRWTGSEIKIETRLGSPFTIRNDNEGRPLFILSDTTRSPGSFGWNGKELVFGDRVLGAAHTIHNTDKGTFTSSGAAGVTGLFRWHNDKWSTVSDVGQTFETVEWRGGRFIALNTSNGPGELVWNDEKEIFEIDKTRRFKGGNPRFNRRLLVSTAAAATLPQRIYRNNESNEFATSRNGWLNSFALENDKYALFYHSARRDFAWYVEDLSVD